MFKRIVLIPAIVATLCFFVSSSLMAQSREDAILIHQEAYALQQKARSNEDLKKAAEKYEEALRIYAKVGDLKSASQAYNSVGLIYASWGQYAKAVEFYQKSLEISRKIGDVKGEGQTLGNLGIVYSDWGQYAKAVEFYQKSLEISRKIGDVKPEANALNNLGNVYSDWGQYAKAVEFYEKSLEIKRKIGDVQGEGRTLNNLGTVYRDWGQYAKAVEFYEKSLAIFRKIGDVQGEGRTLNNLGIVYKDWGQYPNSLEFYEKSLEIKRKIGDVQGEGATLNNLGIVYSNWGQYSKAVEFYEKSLEISRKVGDVKTEGQTLTCLGNVYWHWGQYAKSVEFYQKSLEISRKVGDVKTEGQTLGNLGIVYSDWGQYPKAVEFYEKDLAICRKIGDVKGEGQTLGDLGKVYQHWGEYDKALTNFQQGLEIYLKIGVPAGSFKDKIGNLYLDRGEIVKAEPFIKEAGYNSSLGRLSLLRSDYGRAKEYYEKIRQSAEKNQNSANLFISYTGLGMIHENIGDDPAAVDYFRKAIDRTEDLRAGLSAAEKAEFYNVRVGGFYRTAPYEGLARVLIKLNKPVDALKESEYTRARMFSEALSKRAEGSAPQIPKDVLEKDSQLNEGLAAVSKNLQKAYEKENKELIAVLEPQVKKAKESLAAHIDMLRKQYPLFAATKYPQPMGLDQTALKDNEWVLAYHVTDPGIIIYLTRGKELVRALFKPKPRKELDDLVLQFRKPLEIAPGKDNFDEKLRSFDFVAGKKLSDLLLSDVLDSLPEHVPVVVVPDDSLGILPFEMLVLNDKGTIKTDKDLPYVSGADFFGDRNGISYSQSVAALTLARIHAKSKGTQTGLLAIADPVFHEKDDRTAKAPKMEAPTGVMASLYKRLGLMAAEEDGVMGGLKFPRLNLTGGLAKALAEMHKKGSKVYTGFNASKANFLKKISPALNQYGEVVFATHGYFGKDLPGIMEPVLVLTLVPPGTDGFLRMTEVMSLNMNADIVALTACQTGLGKRTAGEGTMGMGRAFQYAGARSVLMTLWSVSEVTSVRLVKSFFQHMKEGKSKSEALALARDEIRKRGFDHPFFWAPFILVGEAN
jgi:tetratricopeptide (TPR) repeat protein